MAEAPGAVTAGAFDVHAHAVLEAAFGTAGPYGPELAADSDGVPYFRIGTYSMKPIRYRGSLFMDPELRLEAMDRDGIGRQLLSPNPLTMLHRVEAHHAVSYCRAQNDAMAELVAHRPDRFLGAAALPMQDVDAASEELDRAVNQLGLVAPYVGTDFGFPLDDARLDDLYRHLVELDVPLFLHPASTGGAAGPDDARLGRFDLGILFGYAYDETLAVASLVFGGVLDRHPELDICLSHGGGAIAFAADKFDFASGSRPWVPEAVRESGFRPYLKRLWFDNHVHGAPARALLMSVADPGRVVFGTNYGGWDSGGSHAREDDVVALTPNAETLLRVPSAPVTAPSPSLPAAAPT
jgi:aminocarboxymuconate-semialdehyde decarboxylase